MADMKAAMAEATASVASTLDRLLELNDRPESRLVEAMRYAALGGGKRIRPFMVMQSAGLFNVEPAFALRAAAAVEMVHCYSLVHDDLPSMDDDDLRRGQPACHIAFDEATAILAGDALLTRAFEILASPKTHPNPKIRTDLVAALAAASGDSGMVGGQMLDLMAETMVLGMTEITRLQQMKTGRLIHLSCTMGAILGHASRSATIALQAYAHDLGLAFQIADDLLDAQGNPREIGKQTGKDAAAGKATFVSLLGVEQARRQAELLAIQAAQHLEMFGQKGELLSRLADFVVTRRR